MFQAACNRVTRPCGCATWDELEAGEWVRREWLCTPHLIAWLRSEEGVNWSRSLTRYNNTSPPIAMWKHSPGDPSEDPTGRPPLTPAQVAATREASG